MARNEMLSIEVAYALPERQVIIALQVEAGCTVEEAIQESGLLVQFPEIDLREQAVGVFSQPRSLAALVQDGERIEIYRRLLRDPKETRRLKARTN